MEQKNHFQLTKLQLRKIFSQFNNCLDILQKLKPEGTPDLDENNILIAVNGVDSSAIDGKATKLKPDDTVSIIPVIHGGTETVFQIIQIVWRIV